LLTQISSGAQIGPAIRFLLMDAHVAGLRFWGSNKRQCTTV